MLRSRFRFSIVQLLALTALIAIFCVALMNENIWLRAAVLTAVAGLILNALIASVLARGEQQAFSLGFMGGTLFCYFCAYGGEFLLPNLISLKTYELMERFDVPRPSSDHFFIMMGVFWFLCTTISAGFIGRAWHLRAQTASNVASHATSDSMSREREA